MEPDLVGVSITTAPDELPAPSSPGAPTAIRTSSVAISAPKSAWERRPSGRIVSTRIQDFDGCAKRYTLPDGELPASGAPTSSSLPKNASAAPKWPDAVPGLRIVADSVHSPRRE